MKRAIKTLGSINQLNLLDAPAGATLPSTTLHDWLDEAIDRVADNEFVKAEPDHTAFMTTDVQSPESDPTVQHETLKEIGLYGDETKVYAILDDGCNRSCHTAHWAAHAERALKSRNRTLSWRSKEQRTFGGLGGAQMSTLGKRGIPLGLEITDSENHVEHIVGDLESQEIASGQNPLLLSLNAQMKLGMVKDLRAGTVLLKDHGMKKLPIYKVRTNGLHAICISDFPEGAPSDEHIQKGLAFLTEDGYQDKPEEAEPMQVQRASAAPQEKVFDTPPIENIFTGSSL